MIVKELVFRLRYKLQDAGAISFSPYEVLAALNEALRELRKVVRQFYRRLSITMPDVEELTEEDHTYWPTEFDDLINEYVLITLLPGDYMGKEQAKEYWRQKVISTAGQFKADAPLMHGTFPPHPKPPHHGCPHKCPLVANILNEHVFADWEERETYFAFHKQQRKGIVSVGMDYHRWVNTAWQNHTHNNMIVLQGQLKAAKKYLDEQDAEIVRSLKEYAEKKKAEAIQYTDEQIAELKAYTDEGLAEGKAYTDEKFTEANEYTDDKVAELKVYTDAGLAAGRAYTDEEVASLKTYTDEGLAAGKVYTDEKCTEAKGYTDERVNALKEYTETGLAVGKTYTDEQVGVLKAFTEAGLAEGKAYTDERFNEGQEYTDAKFSAAKGHTDEQVAELRTETEQGLAEGKAYTDEKFAAANAYTDSKFTEAESNANEKLAESKSYTDARFSESKSYTDERFTVSKEYTDARISTTKQELSTTITNVKNELTGNLNSAITVVNQRIKDTVEGAIDDLITEVTTPGNSGVNALKDYIDQGDFLNFPPRVGFLGETMVSLNSAFNMSYFAVYEKPFQIITDAEGRESIYFTASSGAGVAKKLFRASRMGVNETFVFENVPVAPGYMAELDGEKNYPVTVSGLSNNYIVYSVVLDGQTKYHLVKTYGSGNQGKWTEYKDITSIANGGSVASVIYFDEYDTIAVIRTRTDTATTHVIKILNLYKYDDLSLVKSVDLFDVESCLDYGEYSGRYAFYDSGAAAYVKNKEHLVLHSCISGKLQHSSGVYHYPNAKLLVNIFHIPLEFFRNGEGVIANLIADSEYKHDSSGKGLITNIWGPWTLTYDEYDECLRSVGVTRDAVINQIWNVSTQNQPLSHQYAFADYSYRKNLNTPDTCPWAKIQYSPKIMGNHLYMNSYSNSYGNVICAARYASKGSQALEIVAGSWWLPTKVETADVYQKSYLNIQCIRIDAATTKWLYVAAGTPIKEFTFTDFVGEDGIARTGKRSLIDTSYPTPPMPSTASYKTLQCWYNPVINKFYYLVSDVQSSDPARQGFAFLLEYNVATSAYKEYRDNLPAYWEALCNESIAEYVYDARIYVNSNAFVDLDGTMYFSFNRGVPSGQKGCIFKAIEQSDHTLEIIEVETCKGRASTWLGLLYLSYDANFGYCIGAGLSFTSAGIHCSKDYVNGGTQKTVDEFYGGSYYTVSFGLSGSSGLIAYLQDTPIFLGGYYSVVPAQEVYLHANSDNYIYLVRNRYDRSKVSVEVRKKVMGVPGENAFNRVLIAKVTTDAANPVSQVNYPVTGEW